MVTAFRMVKNHCFKWWRALKRYSSYYSRTLWTRDFPTKAYWDCANSPRDFLGRRLASLGLVENWQKTKYWLQRHFLWEAGKTVLGPSWSRTKLGRLSLRADSRSSSGVVVTHIPCDSALWSENMKHFCDDVSLAHKTNRHWFKT